MLHADDIKEIFDSRLVHEGLQRYGRMQWGFYWSHLTQDNFKSLSRVALVVGEKTLSSSFYVISMYSMLLNLKKGGDLPPLPSLPFKDSLKGAFYYLFPAKKLGN